VNLKLSTGRASCCNGTNAGHGPGPQPANDASSMPARAGPQPEMAASFASWATWDLALAVFRVPGPCATNLKLNGPGMAEGPLSRTPASVSIVTSGMHH
jgi:hypothetical protein